MIAYLRGTLQVREVSGGPSDRLVVDVGGVGFELNVSRRTSVSIGDIGQDVILHTALSIRETDWTIFGFAGADEKAMFALLQSVSGVGPKLALALVGTLGPETIADAVACDDQKLLSQAPGVGAKVAGRIILELKSKIEDWQRLRGESACLPSGRSSSTEEARAILQGLGYTPTEINLAFKKAEEEEVLSDDVEELVRLSLKVLGSAHR